VQPAGVISLLGVLNGELAMMYFITQLVICGSTGRTAIDALHSD
jgi:hypothetical protein